MVSREVSHLKNSEARPLSLWWQRMWFLKPYVFQLESLFPVLPAVLCGHITKFSPMESDGATWVSSPGKEITCPLTSSSSCFPWARPCLWRSASFHCPDEDGITGHGLTAWVQKAGLLNDLLQEQRRLPDPAACSHKDNHIWDLCQKSLYRCKLIYLYFLPSPVLNCPPSFWNLATLSFGYTHTNYNPTHTSEWCHSRGPELCPIHLSDDAILSC